MIVACAPASFNTNDSETMITVDVLRLLASSLIALVAVTTVVWLLRRPSGRRHIATGCTLSLLGMSLPAAVMAFAPLPVTERIVGHASVPIPAAEPYRAVPPPDPERRGEIMVLRRTEAGQAG